MILGYLVNGPALGWSVVKHTCHGFSIPKNNSKPIAHCKVLTGFLRTNQGVFLSAGIDFGKNGDSFLRLNIACPQELLKEGLGRIKAGVTALNIINKGLY